MAKAKELESTGLSERQVHIVGSNTAARLRRSALAAEQPARACVLRALHTRRHGIPTAFVSLSGVTAMLSAAVRMA